MSSLADAVVDHLRLHVATLGVPEVAITSERLSDDSKSHDVLCALFASDGAGQRRIGKAIVVWGGEAVEGGGSDDTQRAFLFLAFYAPHYHLAQAEGVMKAAYPLLQKQLIGNHVLRWIVNDQDARRPSTAFSPPEFYLLATIWGAGHRG